MAFGFFVIGHDDMDRSIQSDAAVMDDSNVQVNSSTYSELEMIKVTAAVTQDNNDFQELPDESMFSKRPASSPKRKCPSNKKKR